MRGFVKGATGTANFPVLIAVTTPPTKTSYTVGDSLDLTGIVVTATYSNGATKDVTSGCLFDPANGATLSTKGTQVITVTYTKQSASWTTTTSVTVAVKIVTWASGTDAEIASMVESADNGEITLSDYWSVGDERTVSLSAMSATGVDESHVAQTRTLVLMNVGGKTLASATTGGRTTCSFIVGQKECLLELGYMNSTSSNTGGWSSCARRTWCNNIYYNAIPSTLRPIFKQFTNISGVGGGASSGTQTTTDYFAMPAEKEIFGSVTYSFADEGSALTQFTYYATTANRIKYQGSTTTVYYWWERSPHSGYSNAFRIVNSDGTANNNNASNTNGLAPFGVI
jgi:hypothetical protein